MMSTFLLFHTIFIITYSLETRILFGSCAFPEKSTTIFDSIIQRKPDLFIWTGDITYLDYASFDVSSGFEALRTLIVPEVAAPLNKWETIWNITKHDSNYQKLLKTDTPIIGIYDDHDFGGDNTYGDLKYKNYSQQFFYNFIGIPFNDIRRDRQGIYQHYEMQIGIKIIDIILLDTRYFSNLESEDILGEIQWEWLENTLKYNLNGELTLIISGTQIIPVSRTEEENWGTYFSKSQHKLIDLLINYNTNKRLILVTGDIHKSDILKTQCINGNNIQNIYEITSSGLTHAVGDIESFLQRQTTFIDEYLWYDGVQMCNYWGRNFGEINI
eukprot:152624_1